MIEPVKLEVIELELECRFPGSQSVFFLLSGYELYLFFFFFTGSLSWINMPYYEPVLLIFLISVSFHRLTLNSISIQANDSFPDMCP